MTVEFQPFPKIARLNRDITITEKIDGTNAAVVIVAEDDPASAAGWITNLAVNGVRHTIYAQSRNKFIIPGKSTDNYGFAGWVNANAEDLVEILGAGTHFGEWWGSGIQRGYGRRNGEKRFSLFNTGRWTVAALDAVPSLDVVPVLYEGKFDQALIDQAIYSLSTDGSAAAPGFMRPEGIVVYHHALRSSFKVTLEGDEAPKGAAGHALDIERAA